jgi:very-short-patch-repair endonuclease
VSSKTGKFCVKLPFDFYVPSTKTVIEYDGQQHFVPVWGQESFENVQRTDKIKNQYCKKNGIKLIRIPYTMKKEEIEPYILKELGIK